MVDRDRIRYQPTPQEHALKYELMTRLREMAMELQKARRRTGYARLSAWTDVVLGVEQVEVVAYQSGLIVITLTGASPSLHLEETRLVWDEAMFSARMESA